MTLQDDISARCVAIVSLRADIWPLRGR